MRRRGNEFVARVGGEESWLGCIGAEPAVAHALAQRLRAGVAAQRVPAGAGHPALHCTVGIGVPEAFSDLADRDLATRQADAALYAAKAAARDRVVVFTPSLLPPGPAPSASPGA